MSSNTNMNDISSIVQTEKPTPVTPVTPVTLVTPVTPVAPSLNPTQSYDVNKEQNSKVRFLMSYYGY